MPQQSQNYGKTNKKYAKCMQNTTKNEEPFLVYETTETANLGKANGTNLMHADEHKINRKTRPIYTQI